MVVVVRDDIAALNQYGTKLPAVEDDVLRALSGISH